MLDSPREGDKLAYNVPGQRPHADRVKMALYLSRSAASGCYAASHRTQDRIVRGTKCGHSHIGPGRCPINEHSYGERRQRDQTNGVSGDSPFHQTGSHFDATTCRNGQPDPHL